MRQAVARRIGAALALLLLAIAVLPPNAAISQIEEGATLTVLRGQVAVIHPDGSAVQPAPTGTVVRPRDEIRTLTATGALITFYAGTEIEMGEDTVLVVERVSRQGARVDVSLKQVFGTTLSRVQTFSDPTSAYRIEAGGAVAVVRGTEFVLRGPSPEGFVVLVCMRDCDARTTFVGTPLGPFMGYIAQVENGRVVGFDTFAPDRALSIWDNAAMGETTAQQATQGDLFGVPPGQVAAGSREQIQTDARQAQRDPPEEKPAPAPSPVVPQSPPPPIPPNGPIPSAFTTILSLNPTSSVAGSCSQSFVSTPGGGSLGGNPQFVHVNIDLAAFVGKTIRVRFFFDTRDANFNAHEGWYVDNIRIGNFFENVETGGTSWTFQNNQPTPRWHVSNRRAAGGAASFAYQDPATNTFRTPGFLDPCADARNFGGLISPPVTISAGARLEFDYLFAIESVNPQSFDLLQIQVGVVQ